MTKQTGQTEFRFKAAALDFHSTGYRWLVIAGAHAMYKGTGTINGEGNYGFIFSAIDEKLTPSTDVDMFRIKIWDKATGSIIYDNQMGAADDADPTTAIGGGSIVIHREKQLTYEEYEWKPLLQRGLCYLEQHTINSFGFPNHVSITDTSHTNHICITDIAENGVNPYNVVGPKPKVMSP